MVSCILSRHRVCPPQVRAHPIWINELLLLRVYFLSRGFGQQQLLGLSIPEKPFYSYSRLSLLGSRYVHLVMDSRWQTSRLTVKCCVWAEILLAEINKRTARILNLTLHPNCGLEIFLLGEDALVE